MRKSSPTGKTKTEAENAESVPKTKGEESHGNHNQLAGRVIEAAVGDKVAPWGRRSQDNKDANNETRRLFREAVAAMFGGEKNIPKAVADAMLLKDYGTDGKPLGKPLTARRIMAVKAEVDKIVATHTAFNDNVADKVVHGNFNELPQEFQTGLNEIVDDLRKIFGEATGLKALDDFLATVKAGIAIRDFKIGQTFE